MITEEEYQKALKQHDQAEEIINKYHEQKINEFEKRLKVNPIFKDDELIYSAKSLCSCGHGLAYPKDCSINYYWDCSAILKGIADKNVQHTARLPFALYSVKSESKLNGTTRGIFKPKTE